MLDGYGVRCLAVAVVVHLVGLPSASAGGEARAGGTRRLPLSSVPATAALSADGRFVVVTTAGEEVAGDANGFFDVYLHDVAAGTTTLVSADPHGNAGNGSSLGGLVSADGRYVAFTSGASTLVPVQYRGSPNVFLRDVVAGVTQVVNVAPDGQPAGGTARAVAMTATGRHVLFHSHGDVVEDGLGDGWFLRDVVAGTTTRVPVTDDVVGMSADGRYLLLAVYREDGGGPLRPTNFYRYDRVTGARLLVTADRFGDESRRVSSNPSMSADGRFVAFNSNSPGLVAGDDRDWDVFVRDCLLGTTRLIGPATQPSAISGNGRQVVFSTGAVYAPDDDNGTTDAYRYDLVDGTYSLVSVARDGSAGNDQSFAADTDHWGRAVLFRSLATDLVAGTPPPEAYYLRRNR